MNLRLLPSLLLLGVCTAACDPVDPCPSGLIVNRKSGRCEEPRDGGEGAATWDPRAARDGGIPDAAGEMTSDTDASRPSEEGGVTTLRDATAARRDASGASALDASASDAASGDARSVDGSSSGPADVGFADAAQFDGTIPAGAAWELVEGDASDIAAGANGMIWVIGSIAVEDGFSIHRRVDDEWLPAVGGGTRIAVEPNGIPWIVTRDKRLLRRSSTSLESGSWMKMRDCVEDVAVGPSSDVWIIDCNLDDEFGGLIGHLVGSDWLLEDAQSRGVRIAVGPSGPWVVNTAGEIYERTADGFWDLRSLLANGTAELAFDISVSPRGGVYIVSRTRPTWPVDNGYVVKQRAVDGAWEALTPQGAGEALAALNDSVWVTNSELRIYRLPLSAP